MQPHAIRTAIGPLGCDGDWGCSGRAVLQERVGFVGSVLRLPLGLGRRCRIVGQRDPPLPLSGNLSIYWKHNVAGCGRLNDEGDSWLTTES